MQSKNSGESEPQPTSRSRSRLWRTVEITFTVVLCAFIGHLILDTIWLKRGKVRACVKCGVRESLEWKQFAGIRYSEHRMERETALSGLHRRLFGPCEHEWVSHSGSESGFGTHWCSDSFPHFDYPMTGPHTDLFQGLVLFPNDDLRRQALRALAHRTNHLRFLAASAIWRLGWMDHKERAKFNWDVWWSTHKDAFVIATDKAEAKAIEDRVRKADKGLPSM